jgi:hypothetical protein
MVESFNPHDVSTNWMATVHVSSGYNAFEARIEGLCWELFLISLKLNGTTHAIPIFLNPMQMIS